MKRYVLSKTNENVEYEFQIVRISVKWSEIWKVSHMSEYNWQHKWQRQHDVSQVRYPCLQIHTSNNSTHLKWDHQYDILKATRFSKYLCDIINVLERDQSELTFQHRKIWAYLNFCWDIECKLHLMARCHKLELVLALTRYRMNWYNKLLKWRTFGILLVSMSGLEPQERYRYKRSITQSKTALLAVNSNRSHVSIHNVEARDLVWNNIANAKMWIVTLTIQKCHERLDR